MEENPNPPDKKKILIIGAVALFVIVIALVSIFLSSGPQKSNNSRAGSGSSNPVSTGSLSLTAAVSPGTSQAPQVVAKVFYDWYINHPSSIKSGDYKLRQDVTSEFKEIMGTFVSRGIDPGYDHVFCELSSLPKIVTLKVPIFNEDNTLALIMFQNPSTGSDLFQMKLEYAEQKWLVSDVWCPPNQ